MSVFRSDLPCVGGLSHLLFCDFAFLSWSWSSYSPLTLFNLTLNITLATAFRAHHSTTQSTTQNAPPQAKQKRKTRERREISISFFQIWDIFQKTNETFLDWRKKKMAFFMVIRVGVIRITVRPTKKPPILFLFLAYQEGT